MMKILQSQLLSGRNCWPMVKQISMTAGGGEDMDSFLFLKMGKQFP
jgi:hypothetical protein